MVTLEKRFWEKVNKTDSCWNWTAKISPNGYGRIGVGGRNGSMQYAHRISWFLHTKQMPGHLLVCHKCDNRKCVNPEHLFLGTYLDNNRDAKFKGRSVKAEERTNRKLNWEITREIKINHPRMSISSLSNKFNVSRNCIWQVLSGKTWKEKDYVRQD